MAITTKGEMIKMLKRYGIRKAEKQGVGEVPLEHIKYENLCVIFDDFMNKMLELAWEDANIWDKTYGTGDSQVWKNKLLLLL